VRRVASPETTLMPPGWMTGTRVPPRRATRNPQALRATPEARADFPGVAYSCRAPPGPIAESLRRSRVARPTSPSNFSAAFTCARIFSTGSIGSERLSASREPSGLFFRRSSLDSTSVARGPRVKSVHGLLHLPPGAQRGRSARREPAARSRISGSTFEPRCARAAIGGSAAFVSGLTRHAIADDIRVGGIVGRVARDIRGTVACRVARDIRGTVACRVARDIRGTVACRVARDVGAGIRPAAARRNEEGGGGGGDCCTSRTKSKRHGSVVKHHAHGLARTDTPSRLPSGSAGVGVAPAQA
jgi:hypothetical protein